MGEIKHTPTPATDWALNPWLPMSVPLDLKHIGKLGEEVCECGAAIFRCVIQGVDECEPVTKKPNRQWLQDEIADVLANIELVTAHFGLDMDAIRARAERKKGHLRGWHAMLAAGATEAVPDPAPCPVTEAHKRAKFDASRAEYISVGYAPGDYWSNCLHCTENFDFADKRATCCFECATALIAHLSKATGAPDA